MEKNNASLNGAAGKIPADNGDKVTINPGRLLKVIFSRWYWVAVSVLLFLVIGYLYAKSTPKEFLTEAVVRYEDKSKNAKLSTNLLPTGEGSSADYMAEVY